MSLLTATQDDLKSGRGRPLPDRVWRATVQQAAVTPKPTGTQLETRLTAFRDRNDVPEIMLPDGSMYTPGRRIVFDRQWIDQQNAKATEIGQHMIRKLAMSSGLMAVPENGQRTELDFASFEDFASALVGRDVLVRTKQVRAKTKNAAGVPVEAFEDAEGNTVIEAETNGVANTPKFNVEVADYLLPVGLTLGSSQPTK